MTALATTLLLFIKELAPLRGESGGRSESADERRRIIEGVSHFALGVRTGGGRISPSAVGAPSSTTFPLALGEDSVRVGVEGA